MNQPIANFLLRKIALCREVCFNREAVMYNTGRMAHTSNFAADSFPGKHYEQQNSMVGHCKGPWIDLGVSRALASAVHGK